MQINVNLDRYILFYSNVKVHKCIILGSITIEIILTLFHEQISIF